jgi:putative membrane protein (TIGR04086 family)
VFVGENRLSEKTRANILKKGVLKMNTKSKLIAIVVGALVTLALGAVAFAILFHYYYGNVPLLPAVLAPLLCSLSGGYVATRLAQVRGLAIGALSGLVAGLVVVAWAVLFTGPNTVLASVLLVAPCVAGGTLGGWLTRVRLSLELA